MDRKQQNTVAYYQKGMGFWGSVISIYLLVDEYDKPIIDHIGKGEEALETGQGQQGNYQ